MGVWVAPPERGSGPLAGVTGSQLGKGAFPMILSSVAHTAATLGTLTVFAASVTCPPPYAYRIFYLSSLVFLEAQMDGFSKANTDLISTSGKQSSPVNPRHL